MHPGNLIFFLLTLLMGVADFIPTVLYWFQSLVSRGVAKVLDAPIAKRNWLDWLFTTVWLAVGAMSLLVSRPPSIFTLFVFLAFKGGADLGAKMIFGLHDLRKLKGRTILRHMVFMAVLVASVPSILFFLTWKLFYNFLLSVSAVLLEVSVSKLSFYLWAGGVVFGVAFGAIRSWGEEGILLRGELALVMGSVLL